MTFLSLFVVIQQSHANSCIQYFADKNPSEFVAELTKGVIKLGEYEDGVFNDLGSDTKNDTYRIKHEESKLRPEIIGLAKSNPTKAASVLVDMIANENNSFRSRRQAAIILENIPVNREQLDQFEKSIIRAYAKSELLSDNVIILDGYKSELKKLGERDPLRKFRALIGSDIGTNTKIYSSLINSYIGVTLKLSKEEYNHRIEFIKDMLRFSDIDFSRSKQPNYAESVTEFMLRKLLMTNDDAKIKTGKRVVFDFLESHPEMRNSTLWGINYDREYVGFPIIDLGVPYEKPNLGKWY